MDDDTRDQRSRMEQAEAIVDALQNDQIDAVVGKRGAFVLRLREVEQALRLSEERLRQAQRIFGFGLTDRNHLTGTLHWSPEVYRIRKWPEDRKPDLTEALKAVHTEDREAHLAALQRAQSPNGDGSLTSEYRVICADDSVRWISECAQTVFMGEGEARQPVRTIGVERDVTEQKQAEELLRESEARFRIMADGLPLMVTVHDPLGRQLFVNRTFRIFFGKEMDWTCDGHWKSVVHPDDLEFYLSQFQAALRGRNSFHAELRVRDADGQWRWIESFMSPRRSDKGVFLGLIGACVDITERKHTSQQLEQLMEDLERQVRERTFQAEQRASQLQAVTLQLTQAEESERRRMAQVLHDGLQQLLVGAQLSTRVIRAKAQDNPDIAAATDQLSELIDECISSSRSLCHELSPTVLYQSGLGAALHWLASQMRDKHGFALSVEADDLACGLPQTVSSFLFQAARELLLNVQKHAGVGAAHIQLRQVENELFLEVRDEGRGFDSSNIDREILDGFGLFSIRERLDLLGGRMQIESNPGQGTCITLVAEFVSTPGTPCRRAEDLAVQPRITEKATTRLAGEAIRVLLVDDFKVMREGLAALLKEEADIEVIAQASNGAEALELARLHRPQVVIMDVTMPVMDGVEATRRIGAEMPWIRIIGLSMHDQVSAGDQMRRAGATMFLSKDGSLELLLAAVRGEAG
ncbi:MAG: PAS domain-containing protein [Thiogranum sp.]|nr:PAS domain-containing protein [Thiogranum sp.]